jgi:ZIP family zinc transporter
MATPVAELPPIIITGFLSFGLMGLLYLVTEGSVAKIGGSQR